MTNVKPQKPFCFIDEVLDHANREIMHQFTQNGTFRPFTFVYGAFRFKVELRDSVDQAVPQLEDA